MGFAACCGAIPALEASPAGAGGARRLFLSRIHTNNAWVAAASSVGSKGVDIFYGTRSYAAKGSGRRFLTSANAESNKRPSKLVETPLEPESPAGKFLCGVMNDHPHIFLVAAAQQLEDLALERDNAVARRDCSSGSAESHLHERVAEMKQRECQIAVEEVMYLLIFHRFSEIKVPMVPCLSRFMCRTLDIWSSKDKELESIHNNEVLELVRDHLFNVVGRKEIFHSTVNHSVTWNNRLQLGQIYAATIMYGYFLKSICLRHHLEYSFSLTSRDYPLSYLVQMPCTRYFQQKMERHFVTLTCQKDVPPSLYPTMRARKVKKLRNYVMGLDSNALQICAKLKSQEAINLIEKHSRALFLDKMLNNEDEVVQVTYSGMKHLLLEAVAFGTFLWDVEKYIDSVYSLVEH